MTEYVLVPVEPTEEMVSAGANLHGGYGRRVYHDSEVKNIYRDMLAASQKAEAEPVLYMARNLHNKKHYATSYSESEANLFLAQSGLKNDGVEAEVLGLYAAPPHLSAAIAAAREQDARLFERMADEYASEFGYNDMGGLSFGTGLHAEHKLEYHGSLLDHAEAIRALQTEDGLAALREFGIQVACEALDQPVTGRTRQLVDRVLKGE